MLIRFLPKSTSIRYSQVLGGDTTSVALSSCLFYLGRDAKIRNRLYNEVSCTFSSWQDVVWGPALRSCRLLGACLNEAMRMAPSAPGCLWREVCKGGAIIDGTIVPEGCEVGVGQYSIHHDPEYFPNPYSFVPDRFLREPSEARVIDQEATLSRFTHSRVVSGSFAPFQLGERECPAKAMATREMLLFLAKLILLADFQTATPVGGGKPGLGLGRERLDEYQLGDIFSSTKEGPEICFRSRSSQDRQ